MNKFVFDEAFVRALLKDGCPAKVFRLLQEQSEKHPHPKLSLMLETSFHDEMYDVYYLDENLDLAYHKLIPEQMRICKISLGAEFIESYKKHRHKQ
jgi:hypothetical protein